MKTLGIYLSLLFGSVFLLYLIPTTGAAFFHMDYMYWCPWYWEQLTRGIFLGMTGFVWFIVTVVCLDTM
jgi:hypothetical protein